MAYIQPGMITPVAGTMSPATTQLQNQGIINPGVPQQGEGGFGLTDLASNIDLFNGGLTDSAIPGSIAGPLDTFGADVLGIGTNYTLPAGVTGPTGVADGISTNFTPANAAGGLVGGLAANKVFGGGVGTNVGSTIGGVAGSFIPVPFLGSAVGSFIGGGIGSLFGNKEPSSRRHTASFDFSNGNILDTSYMAGKTSDRNDALSKGYANLLGSITAPLGIFNEKEAGVGISSDDRKGIGFSYGNAQEKNFDSDLKAFKDEGEFLNAFFDDFNDRYGGRLTQEQRNALAGTDFTTGNVPGQLQSLAGQLGIDPRGVSQAYAAIHGGEGQNTMQGRPAPVIAGRKNTNWDEYMRSKLNKPLQEKLQTESQAKQARIQAAREAEAAAMQAKPDTLIAPQQGI